MKSAEEENSHPLLRYCHASAPLSELLCPICWELLRQDVCITCCGHLFHCDCLLQWLNCSKTCPQCRIPCELFHSIDPVGRETYGSIPYKIPSDDGDTSQKDAFWLIVAFVVLLVCCRMAKNTFKLH
uniref:RING-type domain-containing protein n=1 Tax=Anopheles dirus TaxID=7168 RepID=A0A182N834_9DIPT